MAWHAPLPLTWALAREYRGAPAGHRAKPQAAAPAARLGPPALPGWAGSSGRRLVCPHSLVRAGRRWRASQPLLRAPTKTSNRRHIRSRLAVLEGIFQHARPFNWTAALLRIDRLGPSPNGHFKNLAEVST